MMCFNSLNQWYDFLGNQPKNIDGSNKEAGQQYEEIDKAKRNQKKEGKIIDSTEKSRQRDKKEIEDAADKALCPEYDEDQDTDSSDYHPTEEEEELFRKWLEDQMEKEAKKPKSEVKLPGAGPTDELEKGKKIIEKELEKVPGVKESKDAYERAKEELRNGINRFGGLRL
jgi:hypothetical protein